MMRAFYYDIVCPYAYLAFSFLRKQHVFKKMNIELKPILLGGLFKHLEVEVDPNKRMPKSKAEYIRMDIKRQAAYFDVPLNFHNRHPASTVPAMRLLHACRLDDREALSERLYRAYFQENLEIDDETVIDAIAKEFGVCFDEKARLHAKESLIEETKNAFANKVFGVPTFALNDRLYFGGDRMILLKDELGIALPDAPWRASETIDFYFDFSSPYSYLAWAEVKKAMALGVKFNCKPVLLGGIFKELNIANVPMLAAHPNKTAYYKIDMADWASHRGVLFNFNSHFPLRTVTALRAALVDSAVIDAIFYAAWALDQNIGDESRLTEILNHAGFNGEHLLKEGTTDAIKDKLKENTNNAIQRGIFGVPSFVVKNKLFFGQDRFSQIRRELWS